MSASVPGDFDHPPIVIAVSRGRTSLLLAGSLAFVAGGVFMAAQAGSLAAGLVPLAFFGACAALALSMLLWPPKLTIGPDGLAQEGLWRTERLAWRDICDFRPATLGIGTRAVGFDYTSRRSRGRLERLNLALAGVEGMLQPGYTLSPHALADLLNAAREHWLAEDLAAPVGRGAAPPPVMAGFAGARMDRKVFTLAWAILIALSAALARAPGLAPAASALLVVFGAHLYAARLHDIGRSGWWQLGLYAIQAALIGVVAAGLDPLAYGVSLAALAQLALTGALGVLPGQSAANRFGPAPGEPSPLAQAEAFR